MSRVPCVYLIALIAGQFISLYLFIIHVNVNQKSQCVGGSGPKIRDNYARLVRQSADMFPPLYRRRMIIFPVKRMHQQQFAGREREGGRNGGFSVFRYALYIISIYRVFVAHSLSKIVPIRQFAAASSSLAQKLHDLSINAHRAVPRKSRGVSSKGR